VGTDDLGDAIGKPREIARQLVPGGVSLESTQLLSEMQPNGSAERSRRIRGIRTGQLRLVIGILGHAELSGACRWHLKFQATFRPPEFFAPPPLDFYHPDAQAARLGYILTQ